MISGRAPTRRAMTGVPQASASIATSPNGSGHEPGISDAYDSANSRSRSACSSSPRNSTDEPGRLEGRLEDVCRSSPARRPSGPTLAAIRSGRPGRLWRSRSPRRSPSPAPPGRRSRARRRGGARTAHRRASGRCGRPRPTRRSGWVAAWLSLIATSPASAARSVAAAQARSSRPWNVETTGIGETRASRKLAHSRWLWMMSNSAARSRTSLDRQVEPGRRRRRCSRPAGAPRGRSATSMPGHLRVAAGEGRDLVAAPVELLDELVDDALGPAIRTRRDALHRRRDLGDAKRTGHRDSSSGQSRPWASRSGPTVVVCRDVPASSRPEQTSGCTV